ncbi:MAG: radical SAM protein [Thermovirgaceae bacterium]
MKRLPFFLPMQACPGRCIYCDQQAITGASQGLSPRDVQDAAAALPEAVEICFFGGSFTCLPPHLRRSFLKAAQSAPEGSRLRLSTHPLCITPEVLEELSFFNVDVVELGVTSLDNAVLHTCRRGNDARMVLDRLEMILVEGITPGAQLMTGLPGQDLDSSEKDLNRLAQLKKDAVMQIRLYPCLVFPNTPLATLYEQGRYVPLSTEECARQTGQLVDLARRLGFEILRVGLHETASLRKSVLAGPAHPALGELARAEALAIDLARNSPTGPWEVSLRQRSLLCGHGDYGYRALSRITKIPVRSIRENLYWI